MALEHITDKIISDANKAADAIIEAANSQAARIISQAKKKANQEKDQIIKEARKEAEIKANRIIVSAELEGRKEQLSCFQKIIDECFDLAVEQLVSLPDDEYEKLIDDMTKAVKGSESMEFVPIPKQQKGGFLLKKEGITLNFSFAEVAQNKKEHLQQQVVEILGW